VKIPVILAQAEIPSGVPSGAPSTALATAPYQALARTGESLQRVGATLGDLAAQKYDQGVKIETAQIRSQIELETATLLQNLQTTQTDPDAFLQQYERGVNEVQTRLLKQTKYPETKTGLASALPGILARQRVAAQKASNDLYISRNLGALEETQANRRITMSLLDPTDEAGWVEHYKQGIRDIEQAAPSLGPKGVSEQRLKWKDTVLNERASAEIRLNPDMDLDKYQAGLKPDTYTRLLKQKDAAMRAMDLRRQRYEKDLDHKLTQDKAALVTEFERRVADASTDADRAAILNDLNLRQELRQVDDGDYRRLRNDLDPSALPSTPRIASFVGLDVHSITPQTTEADIDRLHANFQAGGEGLNLKDALTFKSRVRETREGLASKERAELRDRHQQAEQELRLILGIRPGFIEQAMKDDPIARLYGQGMGVLRARSAFYNGKEDPLDVINDIRPQYIQASGEAGAMKANEILPTLIRPTRQALQQAYTAKQISRDLYLLGLSQFDRLKALGVEPGITPPPPPPSGGGRRGGPPKK